MSDLVVGGGIRYNGQQIRKFLDDLIRRRNQERWMRTVDLGVENEEPPGALTNPLREPAVVCAAQQCFDSIQRVGASAARIGVGRLSPLVDHREGESQVRGHLLGTALLKYFFQDLMGLHPGRIEKQVGPLQESNRNAAGQMRIKSSPMR